MSVQSFVLSSDLIASDVNQCDSLIFKSRSVGCKFRLIGCEFWLIGCETWLIGFDWCPAKLKPIEIVDWLLSLIINNQDIQDWITLELAIRIHNTKGYSDKYCSSSIDATPEVLRPYRWKKRGKRRRGEAEAVQNQECSSLRPAPRGLVPGWGEYFQSPPSYISYRRDMWHQVW